MKWQTFFYSLIPLLLIWVVPLSLILKKKPEEFVYLFSLLAGSLLISYYLSHIPALPSLKPEIWQSEDQAMLAVFILIFVTEANDIFQFLAGKNFGRRKITPEISPNKTDAGFVGGIVGTVLVFSLLGTQFLDLRLSATIIMGVLLSVTGIFGDLLFSSIKRYIGVKDFSELIPGHGGILDRIDSLILTAPLYFHLIYFFKTGVL